MAATQNNASSDAPLYILYIGGPTGFAGGIERYAFQTAQLLRQHGAQMTWCGLGATAREHERFLDGFDRVASIGQVLTAPDNYALVALHKLPDLDTLNALRKKFGERLVFWTHDHDLYCPRRYYYTPFGRTNCHRAYAPLRCQLCSLMVRYQSLGVLPRGFPSGELHRRQGCAVVQSASSRPARHRGRHHWRKPFHVDYQGSLEWQ